MSKLLVHTMARMSSSRCPNKVAYDLGGKPAFVQTLERVQQFIPDADYYFVATTIEAIDDPLVFLAKKYGYDVFRHCAESMPIRLLALFDYLGLGADDFNIGVSGDAPFVICDHLPFAKKVMEKTGLSIYPLIHDGTLGGAAYASRMQFVGDYRKHAPLSWRTFFGVGVGTHVHHLPLAFIGLPAKYQQTWPWNPLFLDFPAQALQIKGIYELLYKGAPIDIFDLPALFEERPFLANLIGPDVAIDMGGVFRPGVRESRVQEILNVTDSIIVEWDGKEGLENLNLANEVKSLTGGRNK